MLRKKEFEKVIEDNQNFFYFKFIGNEKIEKINYENICFILDRCFEKIVTCKDLKQNVCYIRTIFEDFDEEYLEIQLNLPTTSQMIKYSNKELIFFEKDEQINDKDKINIKYDLEDLSVNSNISNVKLRDFRIKEYNIINKNLQELKELSKVDGIKLTTKDKALCLCYKLFYNELPDFSDKDINIKMQVMLSILLDFNICLIDDYDFMLNSKKIPISYDLYRDVIRLIPVGKIYKLDNTVVLDREVANRIKIVGEELRKYVSKSENKVDDLKMLSRILYSSRCCIPTNAAVQTIADTCGCSSDDVEVSVKLVKNISKKF